MKNIMLPAKSCSIILCSLLLLAAGCKKDEPTPTPETFNSNVSAPTWAAPEDYDMTSSMTAVIKVDLAAQYPDIAKDFVLNDNDLLAAFSGETCLGVAVPDDGLFFLFVAQPMANSPVGSAIGNITLRYYSTYYKNLFEAKDAFPYVSDSNQGSADTPFLPAFVVMK